MPNLRYNEYYISVFHLPDKSGNSSCIPFVEIRHKRDRGLEARLMLNEAFSTAYDANAHGFAMGKQWVDEQVAKRNPLTSAGVVTKAPAESQFLRFRLKAWFASLLL